MKKFILALVTLFTVTVAANAMSYEQARDQALFLTDKMAYELNLTDEQYEAAYEINLDYLMGVSDYNNLYGSYWNQRNLDLSYILLDWQYRAYCAASYFYRPLYWDSGFWHFGIYARYPRRDYFYFGRPTFYVSYRGGHSWRMNGGRSWYNNRSWRGPGIGNRVGMRDGFRKGDFGNGNRFESSDRNMRNRSFGNRSYDYNSSRIRNDNNRSSIFSNQAGNNGNNSRNSDRGNIRDNRNTGNRSFGTRLFGGSQNRPESSTRTTVRKGNSSISGNNFNSRNSNSDVPSRTFTPRTGSSGSNRSFSGGGNGNAQAPRSTTPSIRSGGNSNGGANFGGGNGGHFGHR